MNRANGLGNIDTAAVRSLLTQRSFSKPGLAVNATTNTHTITLGGTVQTDDIITVTIQTEAGEVEGVYTVGALDDTLTKAATALELVVEALVGVASSAADTVVTVTPATTTEALTVTAVVTKAEGAPTTTATVAETIIGPKGVKTANTFMFGIDGHTGSQTTQTNVALTGDTLPISSFRWYLAVIDTAGAVTMIPSEDNLNDLPAIPANKAPIGALKIVTDATHTFIPGTTSLNAAGITDTYYDLSCVPKAGYPT